MPNIEIHCLQWTGTSRIHDDGCYTDLARAERRCKIANKALKFWQGWGHRWVVRTLTVKQGAEPPKKTKEV